MSAKIEFVAPGKWRTLLFWRIGPNGGFAVLLSWAHWAVGFELSGHAGSLLLGPVALALAVTQPHEPRP